MLILYVSPVVEVLEFPGIFPDLHQESRKEASVIIYVQESSYIVKIKAVFKFHIANIQGGRKVMCPPLKIVLSVTVTH